LGNAGRSELFSKESNETDKGPGRDYDSNAGGADPYSRILRDRQYTGINESGSEERQDKVDHFSISRIAFSEVS
jgi:hypothetical protein